jgi:hypothetical protein
VQRLFQSQVGGPHLRELLLMLRTAGLQRPCRIKGSC